MAALSRFSVDLVTLGMRKKVKVDDEFLPFSWLLIPENCLSPSHYVFEFLVVFSFFLIDATLHSASLTTE